MGKVILSELGEWKGAVTVVAVRFAGNLNWLVIVISESDAGGDSDETCDCGGGGGGGGGGDCRVLLLEVIMLKGSWMPFSGIFMSLALCGGMYSSTSTCSFGKLKGLSSIQNTAHATEIWIKKNK